MGQRRFSSPEAASQAPAAEKKPAALLSAGPLRTSAGASLRLHPLTAGEPRSPRAGSARVRPVGRWQPPARSCRGLDRDPAAVDLVARHQELGRFRATQTQCLVGGLCAPTVGMTDDQRGRARLCLRRSATSSSFALAMFDRRSLELPEGDLHASGRRRRRRRSRRRNGLPRPPSAATRASSAPTSRRLQRRLRRRCASLGCLLGGEALGEDLGVALGAGEGPPTGPPIGQCARPCRTAG